MSRLGYSSAKTNKKHTELLSQVLYVNIVKGNEHRWQNMKRLNPVLSFFGALQHTGENYLAVQKMKILSKELTFRRRVFLGFMDFCSFSFSMKTILSGTSSWSRLTAGIGLSYSFLFNSYLTITTIFRKIIPWLNFSNMKD